MYVCGILTLPWLPKCWQTTSTACGALHRFHVDLCVLVTMSRLTGEVRGVCQGRHHFQCRTFQNTCPGGLGAEGTLGMALSWSSCGVKNIPQGPPWNHRGCCEIGLHTAQGQGREEGGRGHLGKGEAKMPDGEEAVSESQPSSEGLSTGLAPSASAVGKVPLKPAWPLQMDRSFPGML